MHPWLSNKSNIDLDQKATFSYPHSGQGELIPLPQAIKTANDSLDGKTLSLRDAVEKVKQASGNMRVVIAVDRAGFLILKLRERNGVIHNFFLIRFQIH